MAHQVAWSPRAIEDLEAIAHYISADSNAYAATVVKTILNTTRNLSRFPFAGRIVPELGDENIRDCLIGCATAQERERMSRETRLKVEWLK